MSDEKPWLETWHVERDTGDVREGPYRMASGDHLTTAEARLIAAAPQLARALALAEVADGYFVCPVCDASYDDWLHRPKRPRLNVRHATGCSLDAALTAAGLVTQEQREEARRWGT